MGAFSHTVPKSGCRYNSFPILAMILSELGSVSSFKISVFQGLSAGNTIRLPRATPSVGPVMDLSVSFLQPETNTHIIKNPKMILFNEFAFVSTGTIYITEFFMTYYPPTPLGGERKRANF